MPFWDERHKKALIRLRNRRDLVMIDRMSVYEVQLNNRISVIPEKWPGKRNVRIWWRISLQLGYYLVQFNMRCFLRLDFAWGLGPEI